VLYLSKPHRKCDDKAVLVGSSILIPLGSIGEVASTGSGVIISKDGYIVTNNHVIKGAKSIEVVLNNNKKSFKAKLVGSHASSDLALLKIEADNLPVIQFANSGSIKNRRMGSCRWESF